MYKRQVQAPCLRPHLAAAGRLPLRFLRRLLRHRTEQYLSLIHIYCAAIDRIIHDGRVGEVYNIGGHNERTNLQVVKTILKELGKPESLITFVRDRAGHDMRYAIDPAKMMSELGWEPTTTFDAVSYTHLDVYKRQRVDTGRNETGGRGACASQRLP